MVMPKNVNGKQVKTGSWTPEEDSLLAEWQSKYGNKWSAVAKKIYGRTGQQCAQRWRHKVNPNIRKDKWGEEEDILLTELVHEFGNAWAEISRRMDGRTDQQCMGRWRRHLDPDIKRDAWKGKEDANLLELHEVHGSQWSVIAKGIPGRTAQQCRARWFQVEIAGTPTKSSGGGRRGSARNSRPVAGVQPSGPDAESNNDEMGSRHKGAIGRLCSVLEDDESFSEPEEEEEDEDAQVPTLAGPRRATRPTNRDKSRTDRLSQRSSSTAHPSGVAAFKGQMSEAQPVGRALPDNDTESMSWRLRAHTKTPHISSRMSNQSDDQTPESRPSSAREAGAHQDELASPPFLSQEGRTPGTSLESNFLHAALHYPNCQRSPIQCMVAPGSRMTTEVTPQCPGKNSSGSRMTPHVQLSGRKRGTPGTGFRDAEQGWRTSPGENVLHLLQSPQQGIVQQSPNYQGLNTPEWAKRAWLDESEQPRAPSVDELPFSGHPLEGTRGPVARKLDIEMALRRSSTQSGIGEGPPVQPMLSEAEQPGPATCSPAKKLRSGVLQRIDATPSRLQKTTRYRSGDRTGQLSSKHPSADAMVHIKTMTEKETSACNALKQLSMGIRMGFEEHASLDSDPAPLTRKGAGSCSEEEEQDPFAEKHLPIKTSTAVRVRLHALLEDL